MKSRDRKKYRHKGLKKNTIKTIMGEVEYQRAMYERWKKYDKRHSLVNKQCIAGIMKPKEIKELRDARVYEQYEEKNIKLRVMNGD